MKTPKRIFLISINIFVVLLIFLCEGDQNEFFSEISEIQLYAPQKGADLEVNMSTNTDWKIISQPEWLKVISKDDEHLSISVFENKNNFLRNGKIKIKSDNHTFEIDIHQASFTEEFEKCYVTFDPVGFKGNHLFTVYTQSNKKPNYYWGFVIAHEQNLSVSIYSDQYRIIYSKEYVYNGEKMIPTGAMLLHFGESEFAYKRYDASDYTGGYHGREKFKEVSFFIDDNLINDVTTEFKMKVCERFTYTQKSIMYRDDDAHTEDATHIKITEILDSGYFTKNTITAKEDIPFNVCYGSIASISTDVAEKGYAANYEDVVSFNKDESTKLEGFCDKLSMWNDRKKLSVNIESVFGIYNDYATQEIWDNKYYGKYYRHLQYVKLSAGESWSFETKVTFDKL